LLCACAYPPCNALAARTARSLMLWRRFLVAGGIIRSG
jgi:hypothetical protein